ncbi:hypothetical protein DY120_01585 [Apilactobacillus micheneri]|uniref:DUF1310 family protein n=1 Tax=Apilactobacillus micheneri TaxID=1899430 RepID=A0ABY2YYY2_9LACO|nr:hypothetical protein [Apilactobacillus micheneri]TPR26413.1 hypothetical protein DY114_01585 [Apilactobacillus micheneri]TPR27167.1 hypothetical protein DY111_01585 [Apilactobacillus micheneri]TPR27414.1 hypothetical protein DY113_06535 [Apilactobacillus micheneri]TPR31930.1 hypothetical protein DY117_01585 [Apilactobacillus micheneri]TPR32334.1 hypothetical protein DY120_01585 [Apilactobacillus micheneri]
MNKRIFGNNKSKKLLALISPPIIIAIILFSLWFNMKNNENDSIFNQFNASVQSKDKLKSICKDKNLYNYIIKHKDEELHNVTDNQGGGNVSYYVGKLGSKRVDIFGKIGKNKETLTNIKSY